MYRLQAGARAADGVRGIRRAKRALRAEKKSRPDRCRRAARDPLSGRDVPRLRAVDRRDARLPRVADAVSHAA